MDEPRLEPGEVAEYLELAKLIFERRDEPEVGTLDQLLSEEGIVLSED